MALGEQIVELQGSLGRRLGSWEDLFRREGAPVTQHDVGHGQCSMGPGVARVGFKRLLEVVDGLLEAFGSPLVQLVIPPQEGLVCLGIDRAGGRQPSLLVRRQDDLDLPGDGLHHLGLQRQNVAQVAIVPVGP